MENKIVNKIMEAYGMFSNIGLSGIIMIVILALILFGPNKLPDLGRAAGRTLREFKNATNGLMSSEEPAPAKATAPVTASHSIDESAKQPDQATK